MSEWIIAVIALAILIAWVITAREREREFDQERRQWSEERQQLLDRIQAPSFDHLKQAEVRIIKAQKDEPKKPEIEPV